MTALNNIAYIQYDTCKEIKDKGKSHCKEGGVNKK